MRARLYLVIESKPRGRPAEKIVEPALDGGVGMVQLREKHAPDREIVAAGERLRELCSCHDALFVMNDRVDLALACGADGVHLGQDDESLASARERAGGQLLIGVSTHSPAQVDAALESAADYFAVGPVYETATKPGMKPVGEELVRYAAARATKPFFAIGGIDAQNAGRVAAAGATRIAVVRAIRDADDPAVAARDLLAALAGETADAVR